MPPKGTVLPLHHRARKIPINQQLRSLCPTGALNVRSTDFIDQDDAEIDLAAQVRRERRKNALAILLISIAGVGIWIWDLKKLGMLS